MHTLLKISDLIDNGPSPELAPHVKIAGGIVSLHWMGGGYTMWGEDLLFLTADGLPHSYVHGDNSVKCFKRHGMRVTIEIDLEECFGVPYVARVNHALASLLAEQITTGDKGLSPGVYNYGVPHYGELLLTPVMVRTQHYTEAP